jgi:ribonuclease PH
VQATAEREPFTRDELDSMIDLGAAGVERIMAAQLEAVERDGA